MQALTNKQMNEEVERRRDHEVGVDIYPDDFYPEDYEEGL